MANFRGHPKARCAEAGAALSAALADHARGAAGGGGRGAVGAGGRGEL